MSSERVFSFVTSWARLAAWMCRFLGIKNETSALFQAYIEKEDSKKLKQKQREKVQPKMGKMDIDYQVMLFIVYLTSLS